MKVQLPESWGRKVTEAVIWRKMEAISSWISFSVFSGAVVAEEEEFSSAGAGAEEEGVVVCLVSLEIWTCGWAAPC